MHVILSLLCCFKLTGTQRLCLAGTFSSWAAQLVVSGEGAHAGYAWSVCRF